MKKLTKLIVLVTTANPFVFVHAQKINADAKEKAIIESSAIPPESQAATQVKDLKLLLSQKNLSSADLTTAWTSLDQLIGNKVSLSMKDILELCLLYSKKDMSDAVYEFLGTLKDSNLEEFVKAVNSLSKEDSKRIRELIDVPDYPEKK